MNYRLRPLKLDLKINWKISRNESLTKTNFILAFDGHEAEIAPNIRYGETSDLIAENFNELLKSNSVVQESWCNSFKNAVYNLQLKIKSNGDIYTYLGLKKETKILTSFSLPIMPIKDLAGYLKQHNEFEVYKVKIDHENGVRFLTAINELTDKPLRVDANEAFTDLNEYKNFEQEIKPFNIQFIEQPFSADHIEDYLKLRADSAFEIIADESICSEFDHDLFPRMFHGINVKLMKAPGIERARDLLLIAKKYKMKTMLGCMIESSLGIKDAAYLASLCDYIDLDGALLTSNDPYADLYELNKGRLSF